VCVCVRARAYVRARVRTCVFVIYIYIYIYMYIIWLIVWSHYITLSESALQLYIYVCVFGIYI
jgi:hypothetical protein